MSAPVFIKTKGFSPPEDLKLYYIVAGNGVFQCRNTPLFQTCSLISKCSLPLEDHKEMCNTTFPRIPHSLIDQVVRFFYEVYEEHKSEAIAFIFWNLQEKRYEIEVPEQEVSSWKCECDDVHKLLKGRVLVGDVHSHADFAPGASFTDESDEKYSDGFHYIIGNLNQDVPDWTCDFVVDGKRFSFPKDKIFNLFDMEDDDWLDVPDDWMSRVTKKTYSYAYGGRKQTNIWGGPYGERQPKHGYDDSWYREEWLD